MRELNWILQISEWRGRLFRYFRTVLTFYNFKYCINFQLTTDLYVMQEYEVRDRIRPSYNIYDVGLRKRYFRIWRTRFQTSVNKPNFTHCCSTRKLRKHDHDLDLGQRFTKPSRLTQLPTLSGTRSEYRSKCGDALRLGVLAGRHGSFHLGARR